jgi:hypothetical protein
MSADPTLDLVETTLGFVNANWETHGHGDKPILHHGDAKRRYNSDDRAKRIDLKRGNIVEATFVSQEPAPQGTEYDHDLETSINVRIEGVATSRGHLAGVTDFWQLVRAVRYSILAERTWPARNSDGVVHYKDLVFENGSPTSETSDVRESFGYTVDVVYRGVEELP